MEILATAVEILAAGLELQLPRVGIHAFCESKATSQALRCRMAPVNKCAVRVIVESDVRGCCMCNAEMPRYFAVVVARIHH